MAPVIPTSSMSHPVANFGSFFIFKCAAGSMLTVGLARQGSAKSLMIATDALKGH
jgi:hypothetical protein